MNSSSISCDDVAADQIDTGGDGGAMSSEGMVRGDVGRLVDEVLITAYTKVERMYESNNISWVSLVEVCA